MISGTIILTLLVTGNIILTNGFGALTLQRNKNHIWFVLYNCFTMMLVILACGSFYGVVYTYILDPYNLEPLGILIMVLFAAVSNFAVLEITKLVNKEMYYYYDATYSFVINMGTAIAIMFVQDYSVAFDRMMITTCFIALAYVVASLLFAFAYPRLHNTKVSRLFRPVPVTIMTMSIIALILYAVRISI